MARALARATGPREGEGGSMPADVYDPRMPPRTGGIVGGAPPTACGEALAAALGARGDRAAAQAPVLILRGEAEGALAPGVGRLPRMEAAAHLAARRAGAP